MDGLLSTGPTPSSFILLGPNAKAAKKPDSRRHLGLRKVSPGLMGEESRRTGRCSRSG